MASNNRRLIYNTRERLLSTDLNDSTALLHAKSTDELVAFITGDRFRGANAGSGVLAGGVVGANGADLNITVSPLLALKLGSAATSFDSNYLKIETDATTTIDLSPFVDPGNPRWVAIEVAPGDAQEVVSSRDIFQPALGTFIPQNVDKVRRPEPVFTVNAGTPAASPVLPIGNPNVLPLAYVYIDASAAQIEVLDVVLCRPIYRAIIQPEAWLQGRGGIDVASGLGAGVYQFSIANFSYRPPNNPVQSAISGVTFVANRTSDPNYAAGQAFPATPSDAELLHVYIATPPYPGGYDSDVRAREYLDGSGRIPSTPFGQGFPFLSNGVFVFSNTPPSPLGAKGTPVAPITAVNDPTWNGGQIESLTYLGTVATVGNGTLNFIPQRVDRLGNGEVYFRDQTVEGQSFVNAPGGVFLPRNGRGYPFAAVPGLVMPPHVRDTKANIALSVGGTSGFGGLFLQETGAADGDFGTFFQRLLDPDTLTDTTQDYTEITLDESGFYNSQLDVSAGTVNITATIRLRGYLDSILALR